MIGTTSAFGSDSCGLYLGSSYGWAGGGINTVNKRVINNNLASNSAITTMKRNIGATYSTSSAQASLLSGDVNQAIASFKNTLSCATRSVDDYGYDMDDEQKKSIAKGAIGHDEFLSAIMQNTSSSFWTGVKEGLPLIGLLTQGTSTAEAIAELNGTEASTRNKVIEGLSSLVVPVALGAAACFISGPIGWVAGAGAILGGVTAAVKQTLISPSPKATEL